MPYAPGIQDISGQLIAQGMSQAGAARARAIESLGESISGGIKQYQQNQMFTQQALGKFGQQLQDPTFKQYVDQVINDDPNSPQVPEPLKKAFKNAAAGKVDIYDAALLGTAAEGYQQNQMRQAQTALVTAQANELRNKIAREKAVAQMLGLPTGDLPVEPSVSGQPAARPAAAVSAAVPSAAPQSVQTFMGQPAGAAPSVPSNLAAFDPEIAAAARRESALKFLSTGQYQDPTLAAQRIAAEKRKQSAEERQMTLAEAEQAQKAFNDQESALGLPFGQRRAATVKESGTGGNYVLNIGLAEMTPLEKQQLEAGTQGEKDRLARIGNIITQDRQVATSERSIAPAVSGLSKLLTEDRLEGNSLSQLKTNIRSFAKALNLPVDEQKLTDAQTAIPYFGQLVLPVFNQTKGSISDKETALFQTWSPQLALNKDANLELLSVIDKRMKLSRKLEDLGNKVDAEEIKPTDYVKQRAKLLADYDASIPSVEEFRQKVGAPSQTISDGVRQTGLRQQTAQPAAQTAQSLFNKYVRP